MKTVRLKSGQKMPIIGLGTWEMTGKECTQVVKKALELGYRHIDTADKYGNHKDIALALKESDIERSKLFLTSKVDRLDLHYNDFLETTERLLNELDIEYLDLLLIHWPNRNIPIKETLQAMVDLKEKGKVRSIGVSNFTEAHIEEAKKYYPELISVNQLEFHPYLYQKDLLNFCRKNGIILTAYSPLGRGEIFKDSRIKKLSEEYNLNSAQLVLRWLIEKGIVVIPKASSIQHLEANLEVLNISVTEEALERLDSLNENKRFIAPPFHEF